MGDGTLMRLTRRASWETVKSNLCAKVMVDFRDFLNFLLPLKAHGFGL